MKNRTPQVFAHFLGICLILILFSSCKKELDTLPEPLPTPNATYLYQEFNPFLYTGWVGQTSYAVDSTFSLALDVNQDGITDMTFYIHEWLKAFQYSQDSTIHLPMQAVWVESADESYCQFSHSRVFLGDSLADTNFTGPFVTTSRAIAENYPGFYAGRDSTPSYLPYRLKLLNEWHFGWVYIHVTGANTYGWNRAVIYIRESFLSLSANKPIRVGVIE